MPSPVSGPIVAAADLIEDDPWQEIVDRLDELVEVVDQGHENLANVEIQNAGIQNALHDLADYLDDLPQAVNIDQVEVLLTLLENQIFENEINIGAVQNTINDLWHTAQGLQVPQAVIANPVVGIVHDYHNIGQLFYKDPFAKADDNALPISFDFSDLSQPFADFNLVGTIGIMSVMQTYMSS